MCRIELDDGPFVRELKSVLAPADLATEVFYLPTGKQEAPVEGLDVSLKCRDLLLGCFGAMESHANTPDRPGPRSRQHLPYFVSEFIFGCHAPRLSRLLSYVKRVAG